MPIGAYATVEGEEAGAQMVTLTGMVGATDGSELLRETMKGNDPVALGIQLAERLLERGADRILAQARSEEQ
ncbi:Porphobilinogen deaminase [compost metagenome]